jgi:hypothetical protein
MTTPERFRTITSCYYRGAHGVLLVFDVYNEQSFANLRVWLRELDDYTARDNVARIIVANKCDAPTGEAPIGVTFACQCGTGMQLSRTPRVPRSDIRLLCETLDINAIDVSAKTGDWLPFGTCDCLIQAPMWTRRSR